MRGMVEDIRPFSSAPAPASDLKKDLAFLPASATLSLTPVNSAENKCERRENA